MSDENKPDKIDAKALFVAYDEADAAWEKTKADQESAFRKRSDACQAIYDALGKGPFDYKGQELTITRRSSKDGGETYFFRGKKKDQKVQKID